MVTTTTVSLLAGLWFAALTLVAASPTHSDYNSQCEYGSCEWSGICFPEGQTWTDSSQGCVQFSCIGHNDEDSGERSYSVGALGCPAVLPPQKGSFIKVEGDPTARYPDCCSTYLVVENNDKKKNDSKNHDDGKSKDDSKSKDDNKSNKDDNKSKEDSKNKDDKKDGQSTGDSNKSKDGGKQSDQKSADKTSSTATTTTTVEKETVKVTATVDKKTQSTTSSAAAKSSA